MDVRYAGDTPVEDIVEATVRTIRTAHKEHEGDILAFLPGEGEIRSCAEALGTSLSETHICPLYGLLTMDEQRRAIAPSRPGERKVVLATPIAETSLTIEGVRIVVDAGYCRKPVFDARTSLEHLETVRISRDMATQRTGRAGRVAPGICYRLWSQGTESWMAELRQPEILEADLAPLVLEVRRLRRTASGTVAVAHAAPGPTAQGCAGAAHQPRCSGHRRPHHAARPEGGQTSVPSPHRPAAAHGG
ncbi:MAG: hypothetical protein IKI66_00265 [Bacteroidales bacterium]|nr:hypothetical protein [Bacteroidales bacterium]